MATVDEHQDLIDDIKRPVKYYRIRLFGYGIEGVWGTSSSEEYNFWVIDKNARCENLELDPDENDNPFEVYMFEKEDTEFTFVPHALIREGEWYEQDDLDHFSGPDYNSTRIEIVEVAGPEWNALEIKTIVDNKTISELYEDDEPTHVWSDVELTDYYFQAISSEKGMFFNGLLEISEKINLSKIHFTITECPNGDEIITGIMYGDGDNIDKWDEIDNHGGETNGKGLFIELGCD